MKSSKARGVVLHTVKYGESGLVAYLYTDIGGRRSYMVQGIRSAKSKGNKSALFQPMFLLGYEDLQPHRGELHRIRDLAALYPLSSIPFDVRKSTVSLFMAEVLYRMIRESEPNGPLFDFIVQSVLALDSMEEGTANFHLWFLVRLSYFLGFYPGNDYTDNHFFDIPRGEFTVLPPTHRMFLDRDNARLLGQLMECGVSDVHAIGLNRERRVSFLNALLAFLGYHSDTIHGVRSVEILKEVF